MSIEVPLDRLGAELADRPLVYLATTDGTRVKVVQVSPRLVGTRIHVTVGPGSVRNATRYRDITLVAPAASHDGQSFTLLIDGVVQGVDDTTLVIEAGAAVLHRRASA